MAKKINVGTLISGGGTNLQAIIDACAANEIDAKIVFTGSDNPDAKGLERARKAGIPTFVVDYSAIIRSCRQNSIMQKPIRGLYLLRNLSLKGTDSSSASPSE